MNLLITLLLISILCIAEKINAQSLINLPTTNNCAHNFTYKDTVVPNDSSAYDKEVCSIVDLHYEKISNSIKESMNEACPSNMWDNFEGGKERAIFLLKNDPTLGQQQVQLLKMCLDENFPTKMINDIMSDSSLFSVGLINTVNGECVAGLIEQTGVGNRFYYLVGSKNCSDTYLTEPPNTGLMSDVIKSKYKYTGLLPKAYMHRSKTLPF